MLSTQNMLGQTKSDVTRHSGHALESNCTALSRTMQGRQATKVTLRAPSALPRDCVVEVLRRSPLPYALQAENVVAIGQDAEPLLALRLLDDHLEADAARLVLRFRDRERQLHVLLQHLYALLMARGGDKQTLGWRQRARGAASYRVMRPTLVLVGRMQTELVAHFAQIAV